MRVRTLNRLFVGLCGAAVVACDGSGITSASSAPTAILRDAGQLATPKLVTCPTKESISSTALVSALGGTVSAGGTTIAIPAGALLSDAEITVTVPASNYMEVDISVGGAEHFVFEAPVTVTLSYARCSRSDIDAAANSVWYIDSETKALLAPMPSVEDKLTRSVTFTTGHLSGYALAN